MYVQPNQPLSVLLRHEGIQLLSRSITAPHAQINPGLVLRSLGQIIGSDHEMYGDLQRHRDTSSVAKMHLVETLDTCIVK